MIKIFDKYKGRQKGRKVTYKTNGPNRKLRKKSNLTIQIILNIDGIQVKLKDCQTRSKNKTLYYIQEIQRNRKN